MNLWKAVTGIILALIGIAVFWQAYMAVSQCNSIIGMVTTVVSSIFGGSGAQSCYNAQIAEVVGIVVLLVGLAVIFFPRGRRDKK